MHIEACFVNDVDVGNRRRRIKPEKVSAFAESMAAIGLQQPISVWSPDGNTLDLVAGLHRLEAAKQLGWEEIDCVFVDLDDLDRELWEIDENLIRADLSDLERAEHTARRAELVAQIATSQNEKKAPHRPSKGQTKFVADTAAKTGRSERAVRRDKTRGEKIAPGIIQAINEANRNTPLGLARDIGAELDAVAALEPDEQRRAVERVKCGASRNFRSAAFDIKQERLWALEIADILSGPQIAKRVSNLGEADKSRLAGLGSRAERAGLDREDQMLKAMDIFEGDDEMNMTAAVRQINDDIRFMEARRKEYKYSDEGGKSVEIKSKSEWADPYEYFAAFLLGLPEEKLGDLMRHLETVQKDCGSRCKLKKLKTPLSRLQRSRKKQPASQKPQIIDIEPE